MNEYTVTIAGPERHDGEAPYDYLIDAASPEEAAAVSMRAHVTECEDDPDFDPNTPDIDGLPTYTVLSVEAGRPGPRGAVNDIRGTQHRPERGDTVLVTWTTTTVSHWQVRMPAATVAKIMADLGYDPAATDMISGSAWHTDVDQLLAAHECPATLQSQVVDSRHVEIPDFQP